MRARLSSQQGLSFTEFTYQLLQAYDFYHLHKHYRCSIQVGGSDQWGNILAGLDLIDRLDNGLSEPATAHTGAYGFTTPLLTTSSGEKFGKSAGNAVWLNPDQTSVFDFYQVIYTFFARSSHVNPLYQYFLKVSDADVEKHLKLFTLMTWQDIQDLMGIHIVRAICRIYFSRFRLRSRPASTRKKSCSAAACSRSDRNGSHW